MGLFNAAGQHHIPTPVANSNHEQLDLDGMRTASPCAPSLSPAQKEPCFTNPHPGFAGPAAGRVLRCYGRFGVWCLVFAII